MTIATTEQVSAVGLRSFLTGRRNYVLLTTRADGRPQLSPVTGAQAADGRLLMSSYPGRAKTRNLHRDPRCAVLVLSAGRGGGERGHLQRTAGDGALADGGRGHVAVGLRNRARGAAHGQRLTRAEPEGRGRIQQGGRAARRS